MASSDIKIISQDISLSNSVPLDLNALKIQAEFENCRKPRTTPLQACLHAEVGFGTQAWPWGRTLRENRSHSSPLSQTGLSVVRGKCVFETGVQKVTKTGLDLAKFMKIDMNK